MVIEAYQYAIGFLFTPMALFAMFVAVLVSIIGGIIPGITSKVTCALFLPFLWILPRDLALLALISLTASSVTAGSITAILLNIPGTNPNAATLLDGYPMNQRGEGNRAIGAAVMASLVGGFLPVFLALAMIPLLLPILMAFKTPELAILVILGLSFMMVLTGESVSKGIASGALGVLISMIGFDASTGIHRFTFGNVFLYDGISIATFALGLFGLSELLDMRLRGQATIAKTEAKVKGFKQVIQGCLDVWTHKWTWFRGALIGYIVGLVPGIGAETAIWVAYGQAKLTSKHPEKFGTGCVEGVIAPEAANNAKESGSLLTTMAFGIPGSSLMAILIGGFLMVGVVPGPKMLVDDLPLAITLLLALAICNVIGGVICLLAAPQITRITRVHLDFVFAGVVVAIFIAAYAVEQSLLNIVVIVCLGLLGLAMKRFGFSPPALLLGFVLGRLAELYILRSYHIYGIFFFRSPLSLILLSILVGLFAYPYLKKTLPKFIRRAK